MQDVNELKNIVIQSFESKGILSQIRAQIRASVFKAIEEQDETNESKAFDWENQKALKIKDNQELVILCKLFENFLTFYDLDYTENVFKHEVNDTNQCGDDILKKVGINLTDKSKPYIFQLFDQPRKPNFQKQKSPLEEKIDQLPTPQIEHEKKVSKLVQNKKPEKVYKEEKEQRMEKEEIQQLKKSDQKPKKSETDKKKETLKLKTESEQEHNFTDENESQNDIFLSQSVGLDITVDTEALEQFDYEESVEDISNQ